MIQLAALFVLKVPSFKLIEHVLTVLPAALSALHYLFVQNVTQDIFCQFLNANLVLFPASLVVLLPHHAPAVHNSFIFQAICVMLVLLGVLFAKLHQPTV